ncbi:MAG TPA: hypothetical protein ENJ25_02770 [Firmicutes bacterium]|uniref:Roadblock/LAMTOR2 domain-containing protein n=1 Tax=candidate division TA06 bacterium TaxID=2250710 RepID=A0A660S8N5_UNCT6|nr:roadblock/LC7 domain-containing protein [candidate division WOR-3 bacterium]RKX66761.1 MAG: hypothetical protein DRP44_03385 [candidate division TA06 bacterium]HFD05049.1 hypothetical protein [Bacillota bacterium]
MMDQNELLANDPGSLFIAQLAQMYIDNGLIDEAIGMCEQTLKAYPEYDECRIILLKAYMIKDNFEKFIIHYDYLQKNAPSIPLDEFKNYRNKHIGGKDATPLHEEKKKREVVKEEKHEDVRELDKNISIIDNMENLIKEEIENLSNVIGVIVSDDTGIPIASHFQTEMDVDETTALIGLTINDMREALNIIELNSFNKIYIEIGKGIVYIFPLTESTFLTVIGTKASNIGMIQLVAKRLKEVMGDYL